MVNTSRRKVLFPEVTDEQWNDWKWQVKNRIETLDQLKKYIKLTPEEEEGVRKTLSTLRMAITPYYLSLIDPDDPYCPIRRQAIPTAAETFQAPEDLLDPLHEDEDSPTPGLTHRYPDRVLMLITDMCSMYCRHCTRRRFAGQKDAESPNDRIEKCIEYVEKTPVVRDVLLSGGDALMVSDAKLEYIIKRLRAIPHVEIIRIGSRTPVVCPQRITDDLCNMLKKYVPPDLAQHPFQPSQRGDPRVGRCLRKARRCRNTPRQPVRPPARSQRLRACDETSGARAGQDEGETLLYLPVRPVDGSRAFPYPRIEGYRDHRGPQGTYLRLRSAYLRGGRSVRAEAARHPSCPSMSSPSRPARWCSATSKVSLRHIQNRLSIITNATARTAVTRARSPRVWQPCSRVSG